MPRKKSTPELKLTEKQAAYVEARAAGATKLAAGKATGSQRRKAGYDMEAKSAEVQAVLAAAAAEYAKKITRDDVLNGFKDAIEMAKLLADPMAMIRGWSEVARVCGYFAPEQKIVTHEHRGRVLSELESLSDDELLQLSNGTVIDAADGNLIREVVQDVQPLQEGEA